VKPVVLYFASSDAANYLVAGIPASARAVRELSLSERWAAPAMHVTIAVQGGWVASAWCQEEMARLAPGWKVAVEDLAEVEQVAGKMVISGAALVCGRAMEELTRDSPALRRAPDELADLRAAGRAIIAATGKSTDGLVSRYCNRPVSRSISRLMLRVPRVTPMHATLAAALTGIIMAICLIFGGNAGLMAGAVLFQAASVIDGVDGEIARATFRSTRFGAMLDSLVDAVTNLAFIGGVAINLWIQGHGEIALAGAAGLVMFALGMLLLGLRAKDSGGPITFDAVKHHFQSKPSPFKKVLTWIAMRDFIALSGAIAILSGLATMALLAFSAVTLIWLIVVLFVLFRTKASRS
jgi:phosphatidylglycerophosphate synthase